jgi:hypothetical protein
VTKSSNHTPSLHRPTSYSSSTTDLPWLSSTENSLLIQTHGTLDSALVSQSRLSQSQSYVTTDGQSASLSWNKAPVWGVRPGFYYCQTVAGLFMWGALSDERTGLPFTIAAGPRQRSHSRVRVPGDLWPYFTVSDSRVPFSSPYTTRRATVEVFGLASARSSRLSCNRYSLYSFGTDHAQKTWILLLRSADRRENTTHVVPTQQVHWRADCRLATRYKHSFYCCMFTISLPGNGNTLPIVGQKFVLVGTCLPSYSLATDIHLKIPIYTGDVLLNF